MNSQKIRRKIRVRAKISGTHLRPRLMVFKSLKYIYVQAIDDEKGRTLLAAKEIVSRPKELGFAIAQKLNEKKIKAVVFDRRGYQYHGKIKVLVEAVRTGGIKI